MCLRLRLRCLELSLKAGLDNLEPLLLPLLPSNDLKDMEVEEDMPSMLMSTKNFRVTTECSTWESRGDGSQIRSPQTVLRKCNGVQQLGQPLYRSHGACPQ